MAEKREMSPSPNMPSIKSNISFHGDEVSADGDSPLNYVVHKYSSYSTNYVPSNIYKDDPSNQSSRWSSDSSEFPQFLILKLRCPSIVRSITFGKFEKPHVCNVKKFCVYGGLTDENLVILLEGGLKNNSVPETFGLRHTVGANQFPVKYIKVMPLQTWGSTFNFSVWHVSLRGSGDWGVVHKCINAYSMYREREAVRLCLKHLREHGHAEAFEALLRSSRVPLEHPFLTGLHAALVRRGDYEAGEDSVQRAYEAGYFDEYVSQLEYTPQWSPIAGGGREKPGMRGGHQMCMDASTQTIYLLGGWDGTRDLSDLWSFSVANQEWTCISSDTQAQGGPCSRSCHKMCLDPKRRQLFTLGRFVDPALRTRENLKSDLFLYDLESGRWTQVCGDTASEGGPPLVFDHQVAFDVDRRVLYVFGGRVVAPPDEGRDHRYSGLYSYHVPTSTWTRLREDGAGPPTSTTVRARIGHSMLLHTGTRELYILGGQRHKEFLTDFLKYDLATDTLIVISDGARREPGAMPAPGFTQKATIDPQLGEMHILAGLSKEKTRKVENVRNSFWIYDIAHRKWSCVYHNESSEEGGADPHAKMPAVEPCPRYAYQLVYDDCKKVHFLFGGNPGNVSEPCLRLDDFWCFRLSRQTAKQVLNTCRFLVRKIRYQELASTAPLSALSYLQTSLYATVDHQNPQQVKEFQALATTLFQPPLSQIDASGTTHTSIQNTNTTTDAGAGAGADTGADITDTDTSIEHERFKVFQKISLFLPEGMAQPRASLVDFIPY